MNYHKISQFLEKVIVGFGYIFLVIPLLVMPKSYFPYVYPKSIIFIYLVSIILAGYLVLLTLDFKKYKPQTNNLLLAVCVVLIWSLISAWFGQNWLRSFWGDWERSEGLILQISLVGLMIVYSSVVAKRQDWLNYFKFSLLVSGLIGLLGIWQMIGSTVSFLPQTDRAFSTLGNAAYFSTYVLWHFFLSLWLGSGAKNWSTKLLLVFVGLLNLVMVFLSGTRGAVLGLAVGLVVWLFFQIKSRALNFRSRWFLVTLGLIMLVMVGLATQIKSSGLVSRLVDFSLKSNTVQTRLLTWGYALKGFKDHPVMGVGTENFNLVFDKYLTPEFYNYTGNEVWFTRAHNKLLDILATEGVVGLAGYLTILGLVFFSLWQLNRNNKISAGEFYAVTALVVAYLVQNLFLFDSLVSYLGWFMLLAYIVSQARVDETNKEIKSNQFIKPFVYILVLFSLVFSSVLAYKRLMAGRYVYQAFRAAEKADYQSLQNNFLQGLQLTPNPEQPTNLMIEAISGSLSKRDNTEQSKNDLVKSLEVYQDQISKVGSYSFYTMYQRLRALAYLSEYKDDTNYLQQAVNMLPEAFVLSPNNIRLYWMQIQFNSILGQIKAANLATSEALKKFPDHPYVYWVAGLNNIDTEPTLAYKYIDQAIDKGYSSFSTMELAKIYAHYENNKDWSRLVRLQRVYLLIRPDDIDAYLKLSDIYVKLKDYSEAKATLRQLMKVNKAVTDIVYKQIEQIKIYEANQKP